MRGYMFQPTRRRRRTGLALMLQSVLLAGSLVATPWLFAAGPGEQSHEGHATPVAMPGWTQTLKGQTVVENAIEGRAGNAEKMEMQHHRLMEKLEQQAQKDAKAQQTSGAFNEMSMMHQYMGQDGSSFLLDADASKGEPVMTSGGKCPADAPVKTVRRLDDQHRDHLEPLARFLSWVYVRADPGSRQGARRGSQE